MIEVVFMHSCKVIDRMWIRNKIRARFNPTDTSNRKLQEYKSLFNDGDLGCIFFALEGTPPRGYAVYNHVSKNILLITPAGNTKLYRSVVLDHI